MPTAANTSASSAKPLSRSIGKRLDATEVPTTSSMVRILETGWLGSIAASAFLIGVTKAAGAEAVFVTMLMDGQPAWLYGRRNDGPTSLSRLQCRTFLKTPTTVSHGASPPTRPILKRLPTAFSSGPKRFAML